MKPRSGHLCHYFFVCNDTFSTSSQILRGDSLSFGSAAQFLLLPDEGSQLLTECHVLTMGLLDEGVLQEVGHRRTSLKILNQTPSKHKNLTVTENTENRCTPQKGVADRWPSNHLSIWTRHTHTHASRECFLSVSLSCLSALSENHTVTITTAPVSPNKPCRDTAMTPICDVQCLPVGDVIIWYWPVATHRH